MLVIQSAPPEWFGVSIRQSERRPGVPVVVPDGQPMEATTQQGQPVRWASSYYMDMSDWPVKSFTDREVVLAMQRGDPHLTAALLLHREGRMPPGCWDVLPATPTPRWQAAS